MTARQVTVATTLLGLILGVSCVSTRTPGAAGPKRAEALVGLDAVSSVLARRTGKSVLIYHSPRCDFCRAMVESAEECLPDLGPQAALFTVDIDSNPDVRDAMGIGPVPVVVFLSGGSEVNRWRVYRPGFLVRHSLRAFFAP